MRATLDGMEEVDWASTKPNNLDGSEVPGLLREWAQATEQDECPPYPSPSYRLYDALPELVAPHVFADASATPIVKAQHGDSSGVRGAAMLWPQT